MEIGTEQVMMQLVLAAMPVLLQLTELSATKMKECY